MWKLGKAWPQEQPPWKGAHIMLSWKVPPPRDGPHQKLQSQAHVRRRSLWKGFIQTALSILTDGPGCSSRAQRVGLLCLPQEDES